MQCLGSRNSNNGVRNVNLHNIPTMSQLGTTAEDKDAREKNVPQSSRPLCTSDSCSFALKTVSADVS